MQYISISGRAQHGKDTTAQFLKEYFESKGREVLIIHYSDLLKHICRTFLDWDGKKDDKGRHLLQYVGTEVFRAQDPDYWVNHIKDTVMKLNTIKKWDYVILADVRFPNEILGLHLHVIRPGFDNELSIEAQLHISENAIANRKYSEDDARIDIWNNGSLDNLRKACVNLGRDIDNLFMEEA